MSRNSTIVIRINSRALLAAGFTLAILFALAAFSDAPRAQKTQENYRDKLNIADAAGGVSIAASADGKYVFVAGPQGVIVSEDFGRTGTWVQTAKLK
ncbi:MAG TPA: hypothetical protein VFB95_05070 [Candidatus Cryosericum sp.]|nr:hypothetical protein [Candidatus Cryosericum sp.]